MGNFWRSLDLPLISREIELNLSWSKHLVISEILRTPEVPANQAVKSPTDRLLSTQTIKSTFQINNAKHYVPVVTFSINHNMKLLEKTKQEFGTFLRVNIDLKKQHTKKSNNLDHMID